MPMLSWRKSPRVIALEGIAHVLRSRRPPCSEPAGTNAPRARARLEPPLRRRQPQLHVAVRHRARAVACPGAGEIHDPQRTPVGGERITLGGVVERDPG